ncbi:MAG: hypothetical protein V4757_07255 [Pseudomonadota bacterium]
MTNEERLESIRGRCRIEAEGDVEHWIWTGGKSEGRYPRVWSPDFSRGGKMSAQHAMRAMWQLRMNSPVPDGFRVFKTCDVEGCISCCLCGTTKQWGKTATRLGSYKTVAAAAARARKARSQRKFSDAQILAIQASTDTGLVLAAQLGCWPSVISKARRGEYRVSSPFAGLGERRA